MKKSFGSLTHSWTLAHEKILREQMEESAWKRLLPRLSSRRHEATKRSVTSGAWFHGGERLIAPRPASELTRAIILIIINCWVGSGRLRLLIPISGRREDRINYPASASFITCECDASARLPSSGTKYGSLRFMCYEKWGVFLRNTV